MSTSTRFSLFRPLSILLFLVLLQGCSQNPPEPPKIESKPVQTAPVPVPEPTREAPKPQTEAPKNTTPIDLNWAAVEGKDEDAVIKMYGNPKSKLELGDSETLMYETFSIELENGIAKTKTNSGTKAWQSTSQTSPEPSQPDEAAALYTRRLEQELAEVQAMKNKSDFWHSREKQIKAELKLRRERQAEQK